MRRKIAKRKRRELLKRGRIIDEYWTREFKRKDCFFMVECECNGWKICAAEYDELSAYQAALECVDLAEEEPPKKYSGSKLEDAVDE